MKRERMIVGSIVVAAAVFAVEPAMAGFEGLFAADLDGYEEVPAVSTPARGWFATWVQSDTIGYRLSYSELEGAVQQAHIHFGQKGVNGGVSAFLCSNLGNAPAGTPECPPAPATISGVITADDVVGPDGQGIDPGEIDELIAAIKAGVTYANVHTDRFPMGEIRGQIKRAFRR